MLPKYKRNNLLRINTKPTYFRNRKPHPKLTTPVPCLYRWSKSEKDYVFVKNTRRSLFNLIMIFTFYGVKIRYYQ